MSGVTSVLGFAAHETQTVNSSERRNIWVSSIRRYRLIISPEDLDFPAVNSLLTH
jgi:hypothetical protein